MCDIESLRNVNTFLLDCDGVLWRSPNVIHQADEAVAKLRQKGCRVAFITNNSSESRNSFCEKLNRLGFEATVNECFCAAYLTAKYMKDAKFKKSAFIVGSKGLAHEINLRGIRTVMQSKDNSDSNDSSMKLHEHVGAVVVGLDRNINYWKIAHAVNYLTDPSVLFIGTNPDTVLPAPNNRLLPCSGAMIAAVQAASGRTPLLLGKPSKHAFDVLRDEFELDPETTCMVGDRLETDILFGRRGGTKTALVFSGFTTKENYEKLKSESEAGKDVSDVFCEPHATFDSLKHLVDSLFQ